jgi:hypothetical protein
MTNVVHARLDESTRRILLRLKRRYGWSDSEVVRQGIRALNETDSRPQNRAGQIVGLGKFKSGITDLGSNKDRLRNFGR